jgi:hypothetical protein
MGFLTKAFAGVLQATVGTTLGLAKDVVTGFGMMTEDGPEFIKQASEGGKKLEESVEDLSKGEIL